MTPLDTTSARREALPVASAARVERDTVAGTADDFLIATHLVLRGGQREIGAALARESLEHFPRVPATENPALAQARRRWFRHHWPEHAQRLEAIAEVL